MAVPPLPTEDNPQDERLLSALVGTDGKIRIVIRCQTDDPYAIHSLLTAISNIAPYMVDNVAINGYDTNGAHLWEW